MPSANSLIHGTLGHTYKITTIDLADGAPGEMYVASVEGLEIVSLWQVAREIEEQLGERRILVGIEDLGAETLILDMVAVGETPLQGLKREVQP